MAVALMNLSSDSEDGLQSGEQAATVGFGGISFADDASPISKVRFLDVKKFRHVYFIAL